MKKISIVVLLLLIVTIFGCSKSNPEMDNFAKCLSDKGVKFFGSWWCPHCANEKKLFGDSMKYVNYIECSLPDKSDQTQVCKEAKIKSYPTFEFADGSRVVGEKSLEELSEKTGCALPQ